MINPLTKTEDRQHWILSPGVKLRPDGGRTILFSVNANDSLVEPAFRFLFPQEAVMLTLFNGQRTRDEIDEAVAYIFGLDDEGAHKQVESLLDLQINKNNSIRSLIVNAHEADPCKTRTYDPDDFIVPAGLIDMSDIRCKKPVYLHVLPTMRCLTNCVYCYANRVGIQMKNEFSLQFYERLLGEAQQCGIETIEFSGGDFFCRRDAFDLIACTISHGLHPAIPTKYPLSSEQTKQLANMGLDTIQISIDAKSPEIIEKMVGIANYGQRILNTIHYLGEAGIRVRTNSVLTPINTSDVGNLARYLAELPYVFKSSYTCYARSLYCHKDELFCSLEETEKFKSELDTIKKAFPKKGIFFNGIPSNPYDDDEPRRTANFRNRPMCTANQRSIFVLPDGSVTVCEEIYSHKEFIIGDLNNQSLLEVWNSPRALELDRPDRNKVPDGACRDCVDFTLCRKGTGRCFRDTMKAYGMNHPHWPDPRCPRAPVGNRIT